MELDEEYPKTCRRRTAQIRALLERVPDLAAGEREELALALNQMADKARDLDEIMDRLLNRRREREPMLRQNYCPLRQLARFFPRTARQRSDNQHGQCRVDDRSPIVR